MVVELRGCKLIAIDALTGPDWATVICRALPEMHRCSSLHANVVYTGSAHSTFDM